MTPRMEGIRQTGIQWKRYTDEVEDNFKIMGIRNWHAEARKQTKWGRILSEAKVHNTL
jgi:hypothetical protein